MIWAQSVASAVGASAWTAAMAAWIWNGPGWSRRRQARTSWWPSMISAWFQRFEGVIEAQQVNRARDVPGGPQSRERIGRRPEADIPQDEFSRVTLEPLDQPQLPDIQRLGFGHRADHRMKGLMMGQRVDAVRPVGEFD